VVAAGGLPNLGYEVMSPSHNREREFFIDNLLVRIHFIFVMIRWTGLAPWEFELPFPGSLTSTFLGMTEFLPSNAFKASRLVVE